MGRRSHTPHNRYSPSLNTTAVTAYIAVTNKANNPNGFLTDCFTAVFSNQNLHASPHYAPKTEYYAAKNYRSDRKNYRSTCLENK